MNARRRFIDAVSIDRNARLISKGINQSIRISVRPLARGGRSNSRVFDVARRVMSTKEGVPSPRFLFPRFFFLIVKNLYSGLILFIHTGLVYEIFIYFGTSRVFKVCLSFARASDPGRLVVFFVLKRTGTENKWMDGCISVSVTTNERAAVWRCGVRFILW